MTDAAAGTTGAAAQTAAAAAAPGAPAAVTPADLAAQGSAFAQQQAAAAAAPAANEPAATGTDAEQLAAKGIDTTGWPQTAIEQAAKAQRDAARYQREAGDQRIASKENAAKEERARILAGLAGLIDPDSVNDAPPTVEKLSEQISGVQAERDAAQRDAALVMEAWQAGIDPTKLDYLRFKLSTDQKFVAAVPTSDDFGATIKASIATQVAADPMLKLAGTVTASGVEDLSGAGGATEITPEAFKAMPMQARNALFTNDRATYDKLVAATR